MAFCALMGAGSAGWRPTQLLAASGRLELRVVDRDTGQPIHCRMHLRNEAGRPRRPRSRNIPFWHDHFVIPGKITLVLPAGKYTFELERGPEYLRRSGYFIMNRFSDDRKEESMRRFVRMSDHSWYSGDLDVRRPLGEVPWLIQAEDLHVLQVIRWSGRKAGAVSGPVLRSVEPDRFYHVSGGRYDWEGGEVVLLNSKHPLDLSRASTDYPSVVRLAQARRQSGAWVDLTRPTWWDTPLLVAHGLVDSIQLAHRGLCRNQVLPAAVGERLRDRSRFFGPWGTAQWAQHIYFHLLNCGLRIPPSAGSGSGQSPNPAGYNRLYVHVEAPFTYEKWWEGLRAGRVTITNGPLLRPSVAGQLPGHVFRARRGQTLELEVALTLSTRDPISYLEIIKDGEVEHSIRFRDYAKSGRLPPICFDRSGWFLIRAATDLSATCRFAMTGPYYVEFDDQPRLSRESARFFLDWVDQRAERIQVADSRRRDEVIQYYHQARDFWAQLVQRANAE